MSIQFSEGRGNPSGADLLRTRKQFARERSCGVLAGLGSMGDRCTSIGP